MPWRFDARFTSAMSYLIAIALIIATFPTTFFVFEQIRAHRFRSALDFTAIAVEEDGHRYARRSQSGVGVW